MSDDNKELKLRQDSIGEISLKDVLDTSIEEAHKTVDINQYFSFLGSDVLNNAYENMPITEKTAEKIRNTLISMKHGTYAAVPLICPGPDKCPIISHCFLAERNEDGTIDKEKSRFPLLRPCPVEGSIMRMKVQQYVKEFISEHNQVNIAPSTMSLLTKLAELDIYEIRCDVILAKGDSTGQGQDLLIKTVEAVKEGRGQDDSEVIYGVKEHPVLAIKERLQKSRDKILQQLIATPEAKLKAANSSKNNEQATDIASVLTNLNNRMAEIEESTVVATYEE